MTGEQCFARLQPYLGAGLSLFAMSAQNMAHDIAIGNRRGTDLSQLLKRRVIEGSAEHDSVCFRRNLALSAQMSDRLVVE